MAWVVRTRVERVRRRVEMCIIAVEERRSV